MAFVVEEIPKDKQYKYGLGDRWAIDHEKDAFLIVAGGVREATFYDLYWKDRIVRINAKSNDSLVERIFTKDKNGKDIAYGIHDVDFHLISIEIPNTLKKDKDAILAMVIESLKSFGFSGDQKRNRIVTIQNFNDSVVQYAEQTSSEIKHSRNHSR